MIVETGPNKRKEREEDDKSSDTNRDKKSKESVTNTDETEHSNFNKEGYAEKFKGPFSIYVKNLESTPKSFKIYKVGKILVSKHYMSVKEVKREGRFKGVIIFNKREEANDALNDKIF